MSQTLDLHRHGQDWPNRDASRLVKAAGLMWHVQILGQGPALLLVHGTGASSHSFAPLARLLAPHFTLVIPDLPGHGFTELPQVERLSLSSMAEDLGQLLEALDIEPQLAAGHSAGAAILIEMCLERLIAPDAVISINGALLPFRSVAGQFFSPLAKLLAMNPLVPRFLTWRASNPATVERLIRNTGSNISVDELRRYQRLFQTERHVAAAMGMMANWDLFAFEKRLGQLDTPLVLIAGSADRAVPAEDAFKVCDLVQNGKVRVLRGLGHLAHEERPDLVTEIVLETARLMPPSVRATA